LVSRQQGRCFLKHQSQHCELSKLQHRLAACIGHSPYLGLLDECRVRVVQREVRGERLGHHGGLVVENWSFDNPIHLNDVTT
jgi:hypothetical protein